jgi:hypothetical protein
MDYVGLLSKYPVNRALTVEEVEHYLPQTKPSRSRPLYQLSVIRMNSTYLECVDKFFGWKGGFSSMAFASLFLTFGFFIAVTFSEIVRPEGIRPDMLWFALEIFILCIVVYLMFRSVLIKECFQYTHYPIRFNRKTRMVHVFRQDGTVMSESWDLLFFTLCREKDDNWDVRGHRLADDRRTVVETFSLPYTGVLDDDESDPFIWGQWEFVRRYMEDGPAELIGQVEHVMDVAEKREAFTEGFFRLLAMFAMNTFVVILMSPFSFFYALGRWICMHTGKIPYWPAEIEAECQIEPDDPYILDAKHPAKSAHS